MAWNNNRGNQQGQSEKMNTPIGGERKSSKFFESGKGKLVARGTFEAQAIHQNVDAAANDPRNSKPGMVSVALFETENPKFGLLVCSPVRQSTGGGNQEGYQRRGQQQQQYVQSVQGQGHLPVTQPSPQLGSTFAQQPQWGPAPAQSWQPGSNLAPPQPAPSFQERYAQPAPEVEPQAEPSPKAKRVAPAKGQFAKKAKK
jgi:hypothetical protein